MARKTLWSVGESNQSMIDNLLLLEQFLIISDHQSNSHGSCPSPSWTQPRCRPCPPWSWRWPANITTLLSLDLPVRLASWKQNIRNWTLSTSYRQTDKLIEIASHFYQNIDWRQIRTNTKTNTHLLHILHPLGHLVVAHVVDILDESIVLLPERHDDGANNNNNWSMWTPDWSHCSLPSSSLLFSAWVLC